MSKNRKRKLRRRIRERMGKTGESYTIARMHIVNADAKRRAPAGSSEKAHFTIHETLAGLSRDNEPVDNKPSVAKAIKSPATRSYPSVAKAIKSPATKSYPSMAKAIRSSVKAPVENRLRMLQTDLDSALLALQRPFREMEQQIAEAARPLREIEALQRPFREMEQQIAEAARPLREIEALQRPFREMQEQIAESLQRPFREMERLLNPL